jgi:hypothetical protein
MSNTLSPELQKQIAVESIKYESATQHEGLGPAIYIDGAFKYAEKWQQEKELRERYEKALKDFADRLKEHCEKMGVTSVVLQRITIDMEEFTLTPKTSTDERGL